MYGTMWYSSPLGLMLIAAEGDALTGAWFEGQKYFAAGLPADAAPADMPVLAEAAVWLDVCFSGRDPGKPPKLAPRGSEFRKMIWQMLLEIPRGSCMTYGALARQAAERTGRTHMSAQAVGGAVGHNPLSVFIPCHRVVGADGSMMGYAGGIEKKRALLILESVQFHT